MKKKPLTWKTATVLAVAAMVLVIGSNLSLSLAQIADSGNSTLTTQYSSAQPQAQLVRTITGAASELTTVAVSRDGQLLASAGRNSIIQLWNPNTGELLNTLNGHSKAINAIAISPNGQLLVSGSEDKIIKLWNLQTGELVHTLNGHSDAVSTVAITPDGQILASGSSDETIKLWNLNTGQLVRTLNGRAGAVFSLAISTDGQTLASGSGNPNWYAFSGVGGTIQLWDLKTGRLLPTTFEPHRSPVNAIAISPDGQTLASAAIDDVVKGHVEGNTVKIHTLKTGKLLHSFHPGIDDQVNALLFSPSGQTLIASVRDTSLWNLQTRELLHTLPTTSMAATLGADGQTLITGGFGKIALWRLDAFR